VPNDPLAYLSRLEQHGIKFGLDNIHAIVAELEYPHHAFASVHIAGTNGKGSVTAMVESALRASGIKTGRYTSPHLVRLNERFAVQGVPVSDTDLRGAVGRVREAVEALQSRGRFEADPTFFEVTTAAAFDIFRSAGVQLAVCEVGLGGRLDATNVLSPMVCAITSIGFDHQQYLGETIAQIAAEKAGIVKAGVPLVIGDMDESASDVIARTARDRQAPLVSASKDVQVEALSTARAGVQRIRLRTPSRDYGVIELALAGAHQVGNAVVAVRILEILDERGQIVPVEAVRQGLARVEWPGRLQLVQLGEGRTLLLDAAHNAAGGETLAAYLKHRGPVPLVFAAMKDKDAAGILRALRPSVNAIVVTRASNPRAADPRSLALVAGALMPGVPCIVEPSPDAAVERAFTFGPDIVVAGSIFLLGDVMKDLWPS
jgi:dihydrofolate synthase/folylpolyglutamate synthase